MFLLSIFQGFERAYPLIILCGLLMIYFVTHDINYLLLFFALGISTVNIRLLKNIMKRIMGQKTYPIIGSGKRPDNAIDCGEFVHRNEPPETSYGMPSGHSNFSIFFCGCYDSYDFR